MQRILWPIEIPNVPVYENEFAKRGLSCTIINKYIEVQF